MSIAKQRHKIRSFYSKPNYYKRINLPSAIRNIVQGNNCGQDNKRYRFRHSIRRAILKHFLAICLCCSLSTFFFATLSFGLLVAYRWITTNEYFALTNIEVRGNKRLSYEDILAQANLILGLNSLELNMEEIETRLTYNPWIEAVAVKRILPDRFKIAITERIPKFWIKREGRVWYADAEGQCIAPVDMEKFIALPLIQHTDDDALLSQLSRLACFGINSKIPLRFDDAAWIKLSYGLGFELYFEKYRCNMSLGINDWEENLLRLDAVWNDLEQRGELMDTRGIHVQGAKVWITRIPNTIG